MRKGEIYAVFIGAQSDGLGGSFDLFNVVDPQRLNTLDGSTVSIKTILRLGIKKVLDKNGNPWYKKEEANRTKRR